MATAACDASAHSSGNSAPEQEAVIGAIATRLAAVKDAALGAVSGSQSGRGAEKADSAKALARRIVFVKPMISVLRSSNSG